MERPPLLLHLGDGRPVAPSNVGQSFAEEAVGGGNDDVAGLKQVGNSRLHAGVARAREGEGETFLRAEDLAEHSRRVIHDLNEVGVKVTQNGS